MTDPHLRAARRARRQERKKAANAATAAVDATPDAQAIEASAPPPVPDSGPPQYGFVIAGVQKAGTSTLYDVLQHHPQIAPTTRKEMHFFDTEDRDWRAPDYSKYHRWIVGSSSAVIAGEATPIYLFWPGALERLHTYNPHMRVILSFRDPIERAYSQWCMNNERRSSIAAFGAAVRKRPRTTIPTSIEDAGGPRRLSGESYVARGFYGQQVRRALSIFPREQLLFLDFHRTIADMPRQLDRVTQFLGVDRFEERPAESHLRARPATITGAPPSAADVTYLAQVFSADLADFAAVTGIDVSSWPTSDVLGGRLTPDEFARQLAGTPESPPDDVSDD